MDSNYFRMQHFITISNRSARQVMDQVAHQVNSALPRRKLTGLIIEESNWVKKGNKSVGVGRQYCGNVGKVLNCLIAMFASLNNGEYSSLLDDRLYLPREWCDDRDCVEEVGIPENKRVFKTKVELAWEIIEYQSGQLDFDFVGAYSFYENDAELARKIDKSRKEIKYSFTNANLYQYTHQGQAYIQAERFVVEHGIKESKQILRMDQFQTRKWNS